MTHYNDPATSLGPVSELVAHWRNRDVSLRSPQEVQDICIAQLSGLTTWRPISELGEFEQESARIVVTEDNDFGQLMRREGQKWDGIAVRYTTAELQRSHPSARFFPLPEVDR